MKKQDLIDLGIAEDLAEKILSIHSKDIETHKTKATNLQTQLDAANGQLGEANTQIESFKSMDIEGVKKSAGEWQTKFEQSQQEHATQLSNLKFEHVLDAALTTAKAKNLKAIKPLLDMDVLKKAYDEKTETIVNFDDHIKSVKEANDYLFASETPPPKFVAGGGNQPILGNVIEQAAREAARLPAKQG